MASKPIQLLATKTKGIIWKIEFDDEHQILAWETRTKEKKVHFSAFDFKNQHVLIDELCFEEEWLLGLDKIINGIAYFHGFESEFSPAHKGILAFDLLKKQVLWQNFSVSTHQFTKAGIIAFDTKIFPRKYHLLHFNNGQVKAKLTVEELQNFELIFPQIILPQTISNQDIWHTKYQIIKGDFLLEATYQITPNQKNQILHIYQSQNLIFTDFLNEDIQKPGTDAFLLWLDKLVYIKNKSEILTYLV